MTIPDALRSQTEKIISDWAIGRSLAPLGERMEVIRHVAQLDPTIVEPAADALAVCLNDGKLLGMEVAYLNLLQHFANVSESLRVRINDGIDHTLLDHYCNDETNSGRQQTAVRLSETLKIGRPMHYFDLARRIRTEGGSIVIIGAGFSYDSYAPLLIEMDGIACSTLDDLGVSDARQFYQDNEIDAWKILGEGWEMFQRHMTFFLSPKTPSEQHYILADLFHQGLITHIVSLNWDDLIEKAYKEQFGEDIPKVVEDGESADSALWKIHGDIEFPEQRWILPYESGRVLDGLRSLASKSMFPGLVIGYREQETVVREDLISVIENRGGITRIRPDLEITDPHAFNDNALVAMKRLKSGVESASNAT